jgi:MFS family permease
MTTVIVTANEQEQWTMGSPDLSTARGPSRSHDNADASEKWGWRLWGTIAILCGALFFDAMDLSSVNVALPTIGSHLRMSASTLQWVVSGYVLGYGGFLLLGGRAADLLGRRRVFLAALAVFALASALGGIADAQGILDALRPTLAILIAVALTGVVALFALLRLPSIRASADVAGAGAWSYRTQQEVER